MVSTLQQPNAHVCLFEEIGVHFSTCVFTSGWYFPLAFPLALVTLTNVDSLDPMPATWNADLSLGGCVQLVGTMAHVGRVACLPVSKWFDNNLVFDFIESLFQLFDAKVWLSTFSSQPTCSMQRLEILSFIEQGETQNIVNSESAVRKLVNTQENHQAGFLHDDVTVRWAELVRVRISNNWAGNWNAKLSSTFVWDSKGLWKAVG